MSVHCLNKCSCVFNRNSLHDPDIPYELGVCIRLVFRNAEIGTDNLPVLEDGDEDVVSGLSA
jgi:hypothetical protein